MREKRYNVQKRSRRLLRILAAFLGRTPGTPLARLQISASHPLALTISRDVRRQMSFRKKADCVETTDEQFYVLKKGELVNGLVFPSWDEPLRVRVPFGLSSAPLYQFVCFVFHLVVCWTERTQGPRWAT